jgi:hypothetical protein
MIEYNPRYLYCWIWKFLITWHKGLGISFYPDYEKALFHLNFNWRHLSFAVFLVLMFSWLQAFDVFVPAPIGYVMKIVLIILMFFKV